MNFRTSQNFFGQKLALALAATSILISSPTFAKPCSSSRTPNSNVSQAKNQNSQAKTIVEIAANNPNFKTLVAAVQAAGLADTLSGDSKFTVFAPTDAAFAALPKGTLENLLKPENKETLQKILTYHVVSGAVESRSLKSGQVKTVEGSPVNIGVSTNRTIRVNNARVTQADIRAKNGIIHVIDRVILPPGV